MSQFQPEAWDVIFIGQYMAGLSGIDTVRKIRERDRLAALGFDTTSRSHAVESNRVRASGYLIKPYDYGDFEKTMELCGVEKIRNARFIRVEQKQAGFCDGHRSESPLCPAGEKEAGRAYSACLFHREREDVLL